MPMDKRIDVRVRLLTPLADHMRDVATMAGVVPEDVIKVALALDVKRWNRESGIRAERDAAMDTLRQIASGKRRTREQRLALSCVTFLDECSNVPPNACTCSDVEADAGHHAGCPALPPNA